MSETKAQQQDPSMEEILASIRRIISEGDEEPEGEASADESAEAAPVAEEPAPEEPAEMEVEAEAEVDTGDVLDLTEIVSEEDMSGEPEDNAEFEVDLVEEEGAAVQEEASEEMLQPEPEEPEAELGQQQGGELAQLSDPDSLVSDETAMSSSDAFAELAQSVAAADVRQDISPHVAHGTGRTLEDIVRDSLRPLLKDWLDKNLPSLVHHLVKKEIERLSRR